MNSCIYVGRVRHRRFIPHHHEFSYRLFMMCLDLDELPGLFKNYWLWSYNKRNIAWFDRSLYSGQKNTDLATVIREKVQRESGIYPEGSIRLVTHMKYFGYGFNPVSFYYCYAKDNQTLVAIVAEITNTPWNEQHCYVLPIQQSHSNALHFEFDKSFHVSPFNSMNQHYAWRFTKLDKTLAIHMQVFEQGELHFDATLSLERQPISSANLAGKLLKFPFMTSKVVGAIYLQALKLWLKRTPFYSHPSKQEAPDLVNKQ